MYFLIIGSRKPEAAFVGNATAHVLNKKRVAFCEFMRFPKIKTPKGNK
jgi:hypothetical protein